VIGPFMFAPILRRPAAWFAFVFCIAANGCCPALALADGHAPRHAPALRGRGPVAAECVVTIGVRPIGFRKACANVPKPIDYRIPRA
jgi:hypothetical protein